MGGNNILQFKIVETTKYEARYKKHPRIHEDEWYLVLRMSMSEAKSGGIE